MLTCRWALELVSKERMNSCYNLLGKRQDVQRGVPHRRRSQSLLPPPRVFFAFSYWRLFPVWGAGLTYGPKKIPPLSTRYITLFPVIQFVYLYPGFILLFDHLTHLPVDLLKSWTRTRVCRCVRGSWRLPLLLWGGSSNPCNSCLTNVEEGGGYSNPCISSTRPLLLMTFSTLIWGSQLLFIENGWIEII